jgi:transcriptional regulator with XRE-family HTH domain
MPEDDAPDLMTIDQLVGWNIKALRKDANLSLREAAVLMTISHYEPWTYQRFNRRELAETPVTIAEMHALADLFGVPLFRLLRRPRHVKFLQINGQVLRAEEYEPDYFWDVRGRTGEALRVNLDIRMEMIQKFAETKAGRKELFAPGLHDDTTATGDLKHLAKALGPAAQLIPRPAKKGKRNGDDQEN